MSKIDHWRKHEPTPAHFMKMGKPKPGDPNHICPRYFPLCTHLYVYAMSLYVAAACPACDSPVLAPCSPRIIFASFTNPTCGPHDSIGESSLNYCKRPPLL